MESLAHAKRRPVRGTYALADTPLVCGVLGVWGKRRYVQRNDRPSSRLEGVEDSLEGALSVPGVRQEHERGACEKDRAIDQIEERVLGSASQLERWLSPVTNQVFVERDRRTVRHEVVIHVGHQARVELRGLHSQPEMVHCDDDDPRGQGETACR